MIELGDPYREMATTCATRPIGEKKVVWKRFESEPFGEGRFQAKVLSGKLVNSAAAIFRKSYPEVYGSPHEFVLMPEKDLLHAGGSGTRNRQGGRGNHAYKDRKEPPG
jgi:hypothetical protein